MIKQDDKLQISSLLRAQNIIFVDGVYSKEECLKKLIESIYPSVSAFISMRQLNERLAETEKLNRVLESGFYLPHAKFSELDDFYAVLGISGKGFIDNVSGLTIKAALLLLSPYKSMFFQKHLNMLSILSQIFQPDLIERISVLKDTAAIAKIISEK